MSAAETPAIVLTGVSSTSVGDATALDDVGLTV